MGEDIETNSLQRQTITEPKRRGKKKKKKKKIRKILVALSIPVKIPSSLSSLFTRSTY